MLSKLPFALRLVLTGLLGVIALWLSGLALYYLRAGELAPLRLLPPQRAATIAALAEHTPPERRAEFLGALSSDKLTPSFDAAGAETLARPGADALSRAYRAALDGRPATVIRPPIPSPLHVVERFVYMQHQRRDLIIGLRDGEILTLTFRSPEGFTALGLPMGLAGGLGATLIALAVLIGLSQQARPLRKLARALDRVDFDAPPLEIALARNAAPEIRALARAFSGLQHRLAELLRARLALIGGISHDLRTFATRLRLRVEAIPDPAERARAIDDIADMMRLLDDSLLATEAGAGRLREELVDLADVAGEEMALRPGAKRMATTAAPVIGDPLALRRIIANLIDNALKYGGGAEVSVLRLPGRAAVAVADRGPGIPQAARKTVLEPFVRLEPSRSRASGGAGLGLAIAQNLAHAQGGEITIADRPGGGALVALELPLFAPDA